MIFFCMLKLFVARKYLIQLPSSQIMVLWHIDFMLVFIVTNKDYVTYYRFFYYLG